MKKKKKNEMDEKKTRQKIIADAYRHYGAEGAKQLKMMFDEWDKRISNCKNEAERSHMEKIAAAEIYKAMGYAGGLTINGEVIIPDERQEN